MISKLAACPWGPNIDVRALSICDSHAAARPFGGNNPGSRNGFGSGPLIVGDSMYTIVSERECVSAKGSGSCARMSALRRGSATTSREEVTSDCVEGIAGAINGGVGLDTGRDSDWIIGSAELT